MRRPTEIRHPALSRADVRARRAASPTCRRKACRSRSRWNSRPRSCLRRARSRISTISSPEFAPQVDAMLARLDAARAGRTATDRGTGAGRNVAACAGARAAVAGDARSPREPASYGAGPRRVLPRPHAALRALPPSQRTASRSAARSACSSSTTPIACSRSARRRSRRTPIRTRSSTRRASSFLPSRCRGSASTSTPSCISVPIAIGIIAPLIAKRLGETPQPVVAPPQSVEDSVAELRATLPRLLADVRNAPSDADARAELRGKLASLRDDADLIGDASSSRKRMPP